MEQNLEQYNGKKVILVRNLSKPNKDGHTAEEIEGTILSANDAVGVQIKPTGKPLGILIKTADIEEGSIRLVPTALRTFKQKVIKQVSLDTVRQHLLDKHSFSLALINTADEKRAIEIHDAIDHTDLGHAHGDKTEA